MVLKEEPVMLPFIETLQRVVQSEEHTDISWTADGSAIRLSDPAKLIRSLLPRLFRHSKFNSFSRQLNLHGFVKVSARTYNRMGNDNVKSKPLIYAHPLFVRDDLEKAARIQRNGGVGKRKNNKRQKIAVDEQSQCSSWKSDSSTFSDTFVRGEDSEEFSSYPNSTVYAEEDCGGDQDGWNALLQIGILETANSDSNRVIEDWRRNTLASDDVEDAEESFIQAIEKMAAAPNIVTPFSALEPAVEALADPDADGSAPVVTMSISSLMN